MISLGSLDGGLIDGGDGTVGVGDEAGDVDGVGTIGVGKTSIAVAESTSIAVVVGTSMEEGSVSLSRPLSIPIATTVATAITTKTSCSGAKKGSTTKGSDSSKFSLPLLDGVGNSGNSLPLAVSVAVAIASVASTAVSTIAIAGLSGHGGNKDRKGNLKQGLHL